MSTMLQADEKGVLHVPATLLPGASPRATYKVDRQDGSIVVSPTGPPLSSVPALSGKERAERFRNWVKSLPSGPALSDDAVSRDSIYN